MGITEKGKIHKISMLTLGLLIDIKERVSSLLQGWVGTKVPKFEDPDEDTPGFEGILPLSDETPDAWARPSGQLSSDIVVSDEADSEISQGNPIKVFPDDFTPEKKEMWQDQLDPSTDEDIPLYPSEVEIPHEIEHDENRHTLG